MDTRLLTTQAQKQNMRLSMKMWIPILECATSEIGELLLKAYYENPLIELKTPKEEVVKNWSKYMQKERKSKKNIIEATATSSESLYQVLINQIVPPLFPTELSQKIAFEIIENITPEGFFDGDIESIAQKLCTSSEMVEKVRARFAYLEPSGVGAKETKEALLFQLMDLDIDNELYGLLKEIIELNNIIELSSHPRYSEALKILRHLKTIPAIDYLEESPVIVPEIIVRVLDDSLSIELNSSCYPEIVILDNCMQRCEFINQKREEARQLKSLLELRKSTLLRIATFIINHQTQFFYGKDLLSLSMKDVADAFGYTQSTISRAIAGKYVACERGIFALKDLFAYSIKDDISSERIKSFVKELISQENKESPLSDEQILDIVNNRFGTKLVRRSITKYRAELGIESSIKRKSLKMVA